MQLGKMLNERASLGPQQAAYVGTRHVQWDRLVLDELDTMSFSEAEREKFSLRPGDLLVCEGGEVGRTAMWRGERQNVFFQKAIHRLRPRDGRVVPAYMLRFMRFAADRGIYTTLTSQSSIAHLTQEKLALLKVPLPPAEEQRRISEVLDTVDDVIQKTEQLIAKLKQMKQGLLHDLLTRGVDDTGELRDPERHPEQFKDSPLGRIPKTWATRVLKDITTTITDGTHQAVVVCSPGADTVPFLYVSCVREGVIDWTQASAINRRTYSAISRGREPRVGMILYTAVGSFGHAAVVDVDQDFAFQRHLACVFVNEKLAAPAFVSAWLNSSAGRAHADAVAIGNAQKTVTLGALGRFPIPMPGLEEQTTIAAQLRALDARVATERRHLEKTQLLKRGLMEDLLTGRVRTTVLEAAA